MWTGPGLGISWPSWSRWIWRGFWKLRGFSCRIVEGFQCWIWIFWARHGSASFKLVSEICWPSGPCWARSLVQHNVQWYLWGLGYKYWIIRPYCLASHWHARDPRWHANVLQERYHWQQDCPQPCCICTDLSLADTSWVGIGCEFYGASTAGECTAAPGVLNNSEVTRLMIPIQTYFFVRTTPVEQWYWSLGTTGYLSIVP